MARLAGTRTLLALAFLVGMSPRTTSAEVVNSILLQWLAQAEKCEDSDRLDDITMVHVAMYEAVNSIARKYTPYKALIPAPPGSSEIAAAAAAAHGVMISVCPDMKSAYDNALKKSLAVVKDSVSRENGAGIGRKAAEAVLSARATANSRGKDPFFAAAKPGVYVPTMRQVGLLFSKESPWVMTGPDELRPPAPPALGSDIWVRDYNEIKKLGGKKSEARTDEQTAIAKFWANKDVRIVVPQLVGLPGRSLVDDARFLALVDMAWEDSYVAMMDGKYAHNYWRPVTAIRAGAADGSDATVADADWEPMANTPPHPEYPCGHCLSAAAVGTVIASEFGKNMPAIILEEDSTLLLRYANAQAYIDEVGESRILFGVHYRNSVDVGKSMGVSIGRLAVERYFKPLKTSSSRKQGSPAGR
jgi:hypothetical protein